jgi:hypothetical protein
MIFLYESDVICSTSTRKDEVETSPSKIHHMEFSKLTDDPPRAPLTPKENQQKYKISSTLREYDATQ